MLDLHVDRRGIMLVRHHLLDRHLRPQSVWGVLYQPSRGGQPDPPLAILVDGVDHVAALIAGNLDYLANPVIVRIYPAPLNTDPEGPASVLTKGGDHLTGQSVLAGQSPELAPIIPSDAGAGANLQHLVPVLAQGQYRDPAKTLDLREGGPVVAAQPFSLAGCR